MTPHSIPHLANMVFPRHKIYYWERKITSKYVCVVCTDISERERESDIERTREKERERERERERVIEFTVPLIGVQVSLGSF